MWEKLKFYINHLSDGFLISAQKYGCLPFYFMTTQNGLSKIKYFG